MKKFSLMVIMTLVLGFSSIASADCTQIAGGKDKQLASGGSTTTAPVPTDTAGK